MAQSELERAFHVQLELVGIRDFETQYKYLDNRRCKCDFAWPQDHIRLIVEVEGGTWLPGGGRHTRGAGFKNDCEKYNEALLLGWSIIRVTCDHVKNGMALNWVERFLKQCEAKEG